MDELIVGTDDKRIFEAVKEFGGKIEYTSREHKSGTERVAEVARKFNFDIIINIQGDEPNLNAEMIDQLIKSIKNDKSIEAATLAKKISSYKELINPNLVRIVVDKNNYALYFTRSVVPYVRDVKNKEDWLKVFPFFRHIGIYGFRNDFLQKFVVMNESSLEKVEKLEQLRILEYGYKIKVVYTDSEAPISIDVPDDLEEFRRYIKAKSREI